MKVVVQRVKEASVKVDDKLVGEIKEGYMLLVSFSTIDTLEVIPYMVKKILNLRIMDDDKGIMNRSILDTNGSILSISQFTLYADTSGGNRPSYVKAMKGDDAIKLYTLFNEELRKYIKIETGIFGAEMQVKLINDGPVTIILER